MMYKSSTSIALSLILVHFLLIFYSYFEQMHLCTLNNQEYSIYFYIINRKLYKNIFVPLVIYWSDEPKSNWGLILVEDLYCCGLFCGHWVKMRGDCSFCWYWWNCWHSLFLFITRYYYTNSCHLNSNKVIC
jgi:hypothetical protein